MIGNPLKIEDIVSELGRGDIRIPETKEPVEAINGRCLKCGYRLA
jgi:hypothetical protein